MNKKTIIIFLIIAALGIALLTGCEGGSGGKSSKNSRSALSEKQLMDILPYELLAYTVNGEEYCSEPKELSIDLRNNDEEYDEVQCTVILEDEYYDRMEFVELDLEYYETGGWQLVGWNRLEDGTAAAKAAPPVETVSARLDEFGYRNLQLENADLMDESYFSGTYLVDDTYDYVSFRGPLTINGTLDVYAAGSNIADLYWDFEIDNSGIETSWADVTGTWTGTGKKKYSIYREGHATFELTISKLKENGWCEGSGCYRWPTEDGSIQEYVYKDASYEQSGDCPANAQLVIYPEFGDYGTRGLFTFTAEGVTVKIDKGWFGDLKKDGVPAASSNPAGEPVEFSDEDMSQSSGFVSIELGKDHSHCLGSTYAEICDWYNGEADVYGIMETSGCYYTYFRDRNANLEFRKADPKNTLMELHDNDYCYGFNGWFGRVFEETHDSRVTVSDVIRYFNATNITKLDVTDEPEAPENLSPASLICMDIELETAAGTKRVKLELEADSVDSGISEDTWTRLYELN